MTTIADRIRDEASRTNFEGREDVPLDVRAELSRHAQALYLYARQIESAESPSDSGALPGSMQLNFALSLLESARGEIPPVPGETAALCQAIDAFLATRTVPTNCEALASRWPSPADVHSDKRFVDGLRHAAAIVQDFNNREEVGDILDTVLDAIEKSAMEVEVCAGLVAIGPGGMAPDVPARVHETQCPWCNYGACNGGCGSRPGVQETPPSAVCPACRMQHFGGTPGFLCGVEQPGGGQCIGILISPRPGGTT